LQFGLNFCCLVELFFEFLCIKFDIRFLIIKNLFGENL